MGCTAELVNTLIRGAVKGDDWHEVLALAPASMVSLVSRNRFHD
jgi:hypothetical protein